MSIFLLAKILRIVNEACDTVVTRAHEPLRILLTHRIFFDAALVEKILARVFRAGGKVFGCLVAYNANFVVF